jgi:toxin ParE1/3/4
LKIVWQDHARAELREAVQYYRTHAGVDVAENFAAETRRVTRQLRDQPEMGMWAEGEARRYPLPDYPYHLVYRLIAGAIIIVALAHQRRQPAYWAGRR